MPNFLVWILLFVFVAAAVALLIKVAKRKKKHVIAVVVVCVLVVFAGVYMAERAAVLPFAFSPTEEKKQTATGEKENVTGPATFNALPAEERDDRLMPFVTALEPIAVEGGAVSISVIGAQLVSSSGDLQVDREIVGAGLKGESYKDGLNRTKHLAFVPVENEKAAQMDAFLSLYVRFELPAGGGETSIVPAIGISAIDDRGEPWLPIYYSHELQSIDAEQPYGIIILKGYSDAATVDVTLGSSVFSLSATDFK